MLALLLVLALLLPQCHPTTTPSSAAGNVSIFAIYGGADPATLRAAGINTILGGAPKLADGYNFTSSPVLRDGDWCTSPRACLDSRALVEELNAGISLVGIVGIYLSICRHEAYWYP